jgi:F-type H+-transporting ATPase subunit b
MGISIDSSFAVQIVTFLVLWMLLQRMVFEPMLRVLSEREERTRGNEQKAESLRADAQALQGQYDERMRAARRQVFDQSERQRKSWREEEREIVTRARDAATARLGQVRERMAAELEEARVSLRPEAEALAARVVDRVLGNGTT